ncbi:MAG: hypothetical protein ACRC1W_12905 [Shewanella sp.]
MAKVKATPKPKYAFETIPMELRQVAALKPLEVSRRISSLITLNPNAVAKIANEPDSYQSLDVLIARVITFGLTAQRAQDAVMAVEWLMSRTIGKAEPATVQGTIDQGARKITYITTIEADGQIKSNQLSSDSMDE